MFRLFVASWRPFVLAVQRANDPTWVEFRAPAGYEEEGWDGSPAQTLHDTLEGWHASVLHAGDAVFVLPQHPDFQAVKRLWEGA